MRLKLFEEYSVKVSGIDDEEIDLLLRDFTEVYDIKSIEKWYGISRYGSVSFEENKQVGYSPYFKMEFSVNMDDIDLLKKHISSLRSRLDRYEYFYNIEIDISEKYQSGAEDVIKNKIVVGILSKYKIPQNENTKKIYDVIMSTCKTNNKSGIRLDDYTDREKNFGRYWIKCYINSIGMYGFIDMCSKSISKSVGYDVGINDKLTQKIDMGNTNRTRTIYTIEDKDFVISIYVDPASNSMGSTTVQFNIHGVL